MEKPILFNTEMVKAILEGRKTQTRRVIKDGWLQEIDFSKANKIMNTPPFKKNNKWYYKIQCAVDDTDCIELKPPYNIGDILWVRETWQKIDNSLSPELDVNEYAYVYKASENGKAWEENMEGWTWKPSIHMPRAAARIFLKVTDVRLERLRDISISDIEKEGTNLKSLNTGEEFGYAFQQLWASTLTKENYKKYGWNDNPWVWVIEFERVKEVK